MRKSMRVVMKFGGTSVGTADAIRKVVAIIGEVSAQHQVVVVVSAMNAPHLRTTDTLLHATRRAAGGDSAAAASVLPSLLDLHMQAARELATADECATLEQDLQSLFDHINNLWYGIGILAELTPRALDLISGQGERCNARIVAAALRSAGLDAEHVDATELIVTDERYGNASPLIDPTRDQSYTRLMPLLERGAVPVVTGFIGATPAGVMTTLGRGGSDYSCAILGAALDADEVWFWKEVDGVMSANPKIVPAAISLPALSYSEMAELSYYGANVLHPRTVYPVVQRGIPIRILNTFNPTFPGTRISADETANTIKAVTAIKDVSLIRVGGPDMPGVPGMAARIFGAIARAAANVLMITQGSSEQNICVAVPDHEAELAVQELRSELSRDGMGHWYVDVQEAVVIIAVVGSGMRGTPGIAGKAFQALGDARVNIIAIAQGSTEYNISFVVAESDGDAAVRVIHGAFVPGAGS
jgi:aspartate kinase